MTSTQGKTRWRSQFGLLCRPAVATSSLNACADDSFHATLREIDAAHTVGFRFAPVVVACGVEDDTVRPRQQCPAWLGSVSVRRTSRLRNRRAGHGDEMF